MYCHDDETENERNVLNPVTRFTSNRFAESDRHAIATKSVENAECKSGDGETLSKGGMVNGISSWQNTSHCSLRIVISYQWLRGPRRGRESGRELTVGKAGKDRFVTSVSSTVFDHLTCIFRTPFRFHDPPSILPLLSSILYSSPLSWS